VEVAATQFGKPQYGKLPFTAPTLQVENKAQMIPVKIQPSSPNPSSTANKDLKLNETGRNSPKEVFEKVSTPSKNDNISSPSNSLPVGKKATSFLPSAPALEGNVDPSTTNQSVTTDLKVTEEIIPKSKERAQSDVQMAIKHFQTTYKDEFNNY
jgi:hypothetical protein